MDPKQWLTPERLRFLKFCVVGGLGVLVNEFVLWLCYSHLLHGLGSGSRLTWSGVIAIGVSIFTNFLLNDFWTWGDRAKRGRAHFFSRLGKYYIVATAAGVVQWSVLKLLTESFGVHYLLSNLAGILAGLVINFVVNNVWTFGAKETG